jgi:hypothetical protein
VTGFPGSVITINGFQQQANFGTLQTGNLGFNVCINAVGQANRPATLTSTLAIGGNGIPSYLLPITLTLAGGSGSPSNLQQIGVFRPSQGAFYLNQEESYNYQLGVDKMRLFGAPGDQPVAGDWFGTGVITYGVFRASTGQWFIDANNNGVYDGVAGGDLIWSFGQPGDLAIVGDWTGDGKSKLGVLRCPATLGSCTFYLDAGNKHAFDPATVITIKNYGETGDLPVANNWLHTGIADQIGVFRPSNGTWYVDSNGDGIYEATDAQYNYGGSADLPIVGNWFGTGQKRIGVFRNGTVYLNLAGNNVYVLGVDFQGSFGAPGDLPVIGFWTIFP